VALAILAVCVFWYLRWRKQGGENRMSGYEEHDKGQPMSPSLNPAKTTLPYYVSPLCFVVSSPRVADFHRTSFR